MKVHELKILRKYSMHVISGQKSFEIRKNDREFEVGDILHLKEIEDDSREYTGFGTFVKVVYIHEGLGLENGYICMSIKKINNICPFKTYDCIGKCEDNLIGCAEGLQKDCDRECEDVWRDFIFSHESEEE